MAFYHTYAVPQRQKFRAATVDEPRLDCGMSPPEDYGLRGEKTMRIVTRSTAIAFAALSLTGSAVAAPVEAVLHSFTGNTNGPDGTLPSGGLIADSQGNLYGTTQQGGSVLNAGTVFKLTKEGVETILYSFCQKPN